jgi:hypothetical protein
VNRLNEWLDSRFIDTRVFADPTEEEMQRPQLWRLWRSLPPRGRAAFFVGGLMRAANQRAEGEIGEPEFSGWLRHLSQMAALVADGALILKFFLHTPPRCRRRSLARPRNTPNSAGRWTIATGPRWDTSARCCRSPSASSGDQRPGRAGTIVEARRPLPRPHRRAHHSRRADRAAVRRATNTSPTIAESAFGDFDEGANVLSGVDPVAVAGPRRVPQAACQTAGPAAPVVD